MIRPRAFASILIVGLAIAGSAETQQPTGVQRPNRAALEQQLRVRTAQVMRRRLGLNDAQMAQLQTVNGRYAPQMAGLVRQERETRQALRAQLTASVPDQAVVGQLIDTLIRLQRERVTMLESEQKDLAAFLTPVQRAKYMALQAQIKRATDQMRRRLDGGSGALRDTARIRPPR